MNLLIVDDHATNLKLLRAQLEAEGHAVFEAKDGVEAIELLNRQPVDAIVSDILMPRMDGYRLCLEVRRSKEFNTIPFIVYTSTYTSPSDEKAAMDLGADKFIKKPSPAKEIVQALHEAVKNAPRRQPKAGLPPTEPELMEQYNARLVAKLEQKNVQLEAHAEALLKAEAQLRLQASALEAAANAIMVTDRQGTILWINPAFTALTGYTAEEAIGKTPRILKSDKHDQTFYQNVWKTILFGQTWRGEFNNHRKDGSFYYGEQTITPVGTEAGKISHFIGIMNDVTKRKRAEEQIHEQARLLDLAQDAIMVCDLEDRIQFWNASAERLYGWTAAEAHGRSIRELLYDDLAAFDEARKLLLERTGWSGELQQMTKDKRRLAVSTRWTLVRDALGAPQSVLIINTDITEKKNMEAQFLRAQRLECIGQLASGVAHDLNNILTPILMSVPMLRRGMTPDDLEETVNRIEQSTQRGAQVIKQLLTLGRGVEGPRGAVQPKHLIHEMAKIIKETFPKSIKLEQKIAKDLWTLTADVTQLHQVLLNLCVNARDAMPKGGKLSIKAENAQPGSSKNPDAQAGPYVLLQVADTGTGIPAHVMDRIFEPFFTTKEVGKGTGLGLATVQGIVRNHGGFIEVESVPDQGTVFKVYLPATPDVVAAKIQEHRGKKPAGRGETILVVDDERPLRDTVRDVLANAGYKVLTAADGIEAVAVFSQNQTRIKAVLSDLMMPGLDGLAVTRILKKIDPQIRILICSGLMDDSNQEDKIGELEALGVKTFLSKPYNEEELLNALHGALQQDQMAQDTLRF